MRDLSAVRAQFPALTLDVNGQPAIYLDNPAGTQVPARVAQAVSDYLLHTNANTHGPFLTSQRSDAIIQGTRAAVADFVNAARPEEIVFGPNMTTLTFAFTRALARTWKAGDEVVVTRLDHDADLSPWMLAAADREVTVKVVDVDVEDCTLDMGSLAQQLSPRTRWVAVTAASNAVGSMTDLPAIAKLVHDAGARLFVDAVHYAPHGPTDVQAWGCDALVCSAYKFYGPHMGILWGHYDLLDELHAYKVRPAWHEPPDKFETGTKNHEGLAGVGAALNYLAEIGDTYGAEYAGQIGAYTGRRRTFKQALAVIGDYERSLCARLLAGLAKLAKVRIWGVTDPSQLHRRAPTVSVTIDGHDPMIVAEYLGEHGVFVWAGNHYAKTLMERLGLEDQGGTLRIGLAHYNTAQEVDRFLELLESFKVQ